MYWCHSGLDPDTVSRVLKDLKGLQVENFWMDSFASVASMACEDAKKEECDFVKNKRMRMSNKLHFFSKMQKDNWPVLYYSHR